MLKSSNTSTDFRLLLPESIWLEQEDFDRAKNIGKASPESNQWQIYLNNLALFALEKWLKERMPEQSISTSGRVIENTGRLDIGKFKVCAIATDNLLDELVELPRNALSSELTTHFYALLEVLEEEEEVIFRGCLNYNELINYRDRVNLQPQDNFYQLPLSLFNTEPNHLVSYCRFLEPSSISLPVKTAQISTATSKEYVRASTTKLSQWLQNVFDETWQTIDSLINSEVNLAYGLRNDADKELQRAKLIDLGMQLGEQNVALLVKIKAEANEKIAVSVQLHPGGEARHLPPNLKLILLSKAGKTLQEVQSRTQDNYIQLKRFKGEKGKRFQIQVSLGSLSITEIFEL